MHARTARIPPVNLTIALLTLAIASSAALAAGPRFVEIIEHAAECPSLDLLLTSSTSGVIRARRCDNCPLLTLDVDENTAVYRQGTSTTLLEADNNRDRGATVMFDPETLRVTRILLRQ
jgi:hypothetical protein